MRHGVWVLVATLFAWLFALFALRNYAVVAAISLGTLIVGGLYMGATKQSNLSNKGEEKHGN